MRQPNIKKVYTKTPAKERAARGKVALKMARCYDKINSTPKALAAYSNAIRYKQADLNDRLAYARLLLKNGSYRQAAKEFEFLLDSMPDNVLVKNGLESARKAPVWKKEGSRYKVKRMDVFNSRRDDYSPMFLSDDYSQPGSRISLPLTLNSIFSGFGPSSLMTSPKTVVVENLQSG